MNQTSFDFTARARSSDPGTSHAAARGVADSLPRLQQLVLDALKRCGKRGATSYELADMLRIDRVTISPRLKPLAEAGYVIASTERRLGPTGRPGIVWKVA